MSNLSRRSFLRTGLAGGATLAVSTVSTAALAAKPAKGLYIPGTYSAKAAGIGDIVVTMTFDENRITDVVLNVAHETPSIGQAAAERLKSSLMAAQSAQIDVVSGASITSNAVMKAAGKCIAQAKGEIPVEVVSNGADADADSGDWLGKAPEIAEKSITATYTTDVLVVGCGTGGLFAVCAAAEEGAKVIGIDRFSTGTGVRGDVGGLDSRYQKAWGTKIDKFDFVTMMTQYAAGHINQDLVKVFCEQSGAVVDWYGDRLAERGVELWHESGDKDDHTRYEHFAIGHSPRWAGKTTEDGKKLNGNIVLVDYAKKLGARFDYNTRMVKLEKQAGRVTGCIAETGDGKFVRYIAKKGVVVATGGYAQNYQMLEALQPWNLRVIGRNGGLPGARGDGIRACLWAGAAMDETHSTMLFDRCALRIDQPTGAETAKKGDSGFFWIGSQPWLKVNADGKRFIDEVGTRDVVSAAEIAQPGSYSWLVVDQAMADASSVIQGYIKKGYTAEGATYEELAKAIGVDEATFAETMNNWNQCVADKADAEFGRTSFANPLDTAPYYAIKVTAGVHHTMGGLTINTNTEVLDTNGNVIPGLFAAGEITGGVHGANRLGGNAVADFTVFGRIAGQAASDYAA